LQGKKRESLESGSDSESGLNTKRSKLSGLHNNSAYTKDTKEVEKGVWKLDRLKTSLKKPGLLQNGVDSDEQQNCFKDLNKKSAQHEPAGKTAADYKEVTSSSVLVVKPEKEQLGPAEVEEKSATNKDAKNHMESDKDRSAKSVSSSAEWNKGDSDVKSAVILNRQAEKTQRSDSEDSKKNVKDSHVHKTLELKDARSQSANVPKYLTDKKFDKWHAADEEQKKNIKDRKSGGFVIPKVSKRSDSQMECSSESPLSVLELRRKASEEPKRMNVQGKAFNSAKSVNTKFVGVKNVQSSFSSVRTPSKPSSTAGQNRISKPLKVCDSSSVGVLDMIEQHPGYVGKQIPEKKKVAESSTTGTKTVADCQSSVSDNRQLPDLGTPIPTISGRRSFSDRPNQMSNQPCVVGGERIPPVSGRSITGFDRLPAVDDSLGTKATPGGVSSADPHLYIGPSVSAVVAPGQKMLENCSSNKFSIKQAEAGQPPHKPFPLPVADADSQSAAFDDSPEMSDTASPHLTFRTPVSILNNAASQPVAGMLDANAKTHILSGMPTVSAAMPVEGYKKMHSSLTVPLLPPPVALPNQGYPAMYPAVGLPPPPVMVPPEGFQNMFTGPPILPPPPLVTGGGCLSSNLPSLITSLPVIRQSENTGNVCPQSVVQGPSVVPVQEAVAPLRKIPLLPTPTDLSPKLPSAAAARQLGQVAVSVPPVGPSQGLLPTPDRSHPEATQTLGL
jgi:hypothetical protein